MAKLGFLSFVAMFGTLAIGCGGAGDPEAEQISDVRISGDVSQAGTCESLLVETWFGPARAEIDARLSCEVTLEDECAALGCDAELSSLSVRGHGTGADTNWYCQGVVEDSSGEMPTYFGRCRTPSTDDASAIR